MSESTATPASSPSEGPIEIGAARDPAFLRAARPYFERFASYFRSEVRGFDRVPRSGPMLVVGNHSGGMLPPDVPVLLSAWWRERGEEEAIYTLFHSAVFAIPGFGSAMAKGGGIEAGPNAAEQLLDEGNIVLVFPGGDHEVFRPWTQRNHIDFAGRTGAVRLALRKQVPVVPAVSVGAHETVVVLTSGEALARRLGLDKRFRISVLPLILGPLGVMPGFVPTIPLPAKITVELLEPICWADRYGPDAADDDEIVQACYEELVSAMQTAMDALAAERDLPVLG